MFPSDCQEFEYATHPDSARILRESAAAALKLLRAPAPIDLIKDTRPIHHVLFEALCPEGLEYYAGHYRGENFRCLQHYPVGIESDRRVGYPPERVLAAMGGLEKSIAADMAGIDAAHAKPGLSAGEKLIFSVAYACRLFIEFLTVHPYANGNGHIARWIITAVLRQHGYKLNNFPVEPRPPDPPYSDMIFRYRNGEVELLESYIIRLISIPQKAQR
jgi:hypothetical protein